MLVTSNNSSIILANNQMELTWVKLPFVDFSSSQIDGGAFFCQTPIDSIVFLLKVIL